jgi:transcriptional regulator GlxA family with amidase domain
LPTKLSSPPADLRISWLLTQLSKEDLRTHTKVDHFAKRLRLSSSRFRHLFTQATGVSFARYVKDKRLAQARYLMEHSLLSVKEVMVAVGVNDVSHFVRDYKLLYGERPSDSRRKQLLMRCPAPTQTPLS